MKKFCYTLKDKLGIHARPAGFIVRQATTYQSDILIQCQDRKADAKKVFSMMKLRAKCGDLLHIEINGPDEIQAAEELQRFFESENF